MPLKNSFPCLSLLRIHIKWVKQKSKVGLVSRWVCMIVFDSLVVMQRTLKMQRRISLHIVHGTALCQHRRHKLRPLLSRGILTSSIVFHLDLRPQTFSLVPLISWLHQSWHSCVCRRHASWQTWLKFLCLCASYSFFLAQKVHPASTIMRLVVQSQLWWLMRSVFLVAVFVHLA